MRTFAELQDHLRAVTGQDAALLEGAWTRYDKNEDGTPGGWVWKGLRIEPGVHIGEHAAVYGAMTALLKGARVEGDSVVGPHVILSGGTVVSGGAHVTGEIPGDKSRDKKDAYVLHESRVDGAGTWVCQSDLNQSSVQDGAWSLQSHLNQATVSDPATFVHQTDIGAPWNVTAAYGSSVTVKIDAPRDTEETIVRNGAQLADCRVGPGVAVDRAVSRSGQELLSSDESLTRPETLDAAAPSKEWMREVAFGRPSSGTISRPREKKQTRVM
ncbi:MAG: hypothetical protein PW734_12360 [Verrucomicrobium sp.]|nr:hypothetical protein [Verrucomicrobium sp.]